MNISRSGILLACAAMAGLLMISCGGGGGVPPSSAAQNLCDALVQCAEEDGVEISQEEADECVEDIEADIEYDAEYLGDGSEDCARHVAAVYDCWANQSCDDIFDEGACSMELEEAEEVCAESENGNGGGGSSEVEAVCQREVDCGHLTQGEYSDCVAELSAELDQATAQCRSAVETAYSCMASVSCEQDAFMACESEWMEVEAQCE